MCRGADKTSTLQLGGMQSLDTAISATAALTDGSCTLLGTATGQIVQLPSPSHQHQHNEEVTDGKAQIPPKSPPQHGTDKPASLQPHLGTEQLTNESVTASATSDGVDDPARARKKLGSDATSSGGGPANQSQPTGSRWTLDTETTVYSLTQQHSAAVTALALSSTGACLASLSALDDVIMLWQSSTETRRDWIMLTRLSVAEAVCMAWMPEPPQQGPTSLLVGTKTGQLLVWCNY